MKKSALTLVLILLPLAFASSDLTTWNGNEWMRLSYQEKISFAEGYMLALYTMAYDIRRNVPGDSLYLNEMIIQNKTAEELVSEVDQIYRDEINRGIPVAIALYFNQRLIGGR